MHLMYESAFLQLNLIDIKKRIQLHFDAWKSLFCLPVLCAVLDINLFFHNKALYLVRTLLFIFASQ